MIGVVSLSLAACGGGDSTVQTAPVTQTPPNDGEPDCTAVPRPAGCPDPEPTPPAVPLPLDGLGQAAKGGAAPAIREVADTQPVAFIRDKRSIHGILLRHPRNNFPASVDYRNLDTKFAKAVPSGSAGDIDWLFELSTPKYESRQSVFDFLQIQLRLTPFHADNKIFSLKDNNAFTSVETIESIASQWGKGWDYSILQASVPSVKDGAKDSTLYAELWTDVASAGKSDYMVGGWWLLAPNNPAGDYRFGALARVENLYGGGAYTSSNILAPLTGNATYKGPAAGLHTSPENGIQRLLGTATLTIDFRDASKRGNIEGKIDSLTLGGESVRGEILLPQALVSLGMPILPSQTNLNPRSPIGNIKGINYEGSWQVAYQGDSSRTEHPTGIFGIVGGSGEGNSFVASFGAKKVEDE